MKFKSLKNSKKISNKKVLTKKVVDWPVSDLRKMSARSYWSARDQNDQESKKAGQNGRLTSEVCIKNFVSYSTVSVIFHGQL